jgi:hypothetical protein
VTDRDDEPTDAERTAVDAPETIVDAAQTVLVPDDSTVHVTDTPAVRTITVEDAPPRTRQRSPLLFVLPVALLAATCVGCALFWAFGGDDDPLATCAVEHGDDELVAVCDVAPPAAGRYRVVPVLDPDGAATRAFEEVLDVRAGQRVTRRYVFQRSDRLATVQRCACEITRLR